MKLAIYNLLIMLLIPVFQGRLLFKSIRDADYRKHFLHRLGWGLTPARRAKQKILWFHAVSLGEVIGSQNVITELLLEFDVVLTTSTPTGLRKARELFQDRATINYAPWDLSFFIRKLLNFYKPDAVLIFETEIWPSLISVSESSNLPIYLINGRLSEKSYKTYLMTSWFMEDIIKKITFTFVQTAKHRERFLKLGMHKKNIQIVGSVKFDLPSLKPVLASLSPYILAASTHPGEDEIILRAYNRLDEKSIFQLFICPRHPERSSEIRQMAKQMNFNTVLYSESNDDDFDVCIIDGAGLLRDFYAGAAAAFVGGSLVPRGGHNLIEPASSGTPILIGQYTFNFEEIVEEFINKDACILVKDEEELFKGLQLILSDSKTARKLSDNAKKIVESNKGSTQKQVSYIINQLGETN